MTIEKTLTSAHQKILEELKNQLYIAIESLGDNSNISVIKTRIDHLNTSFYLNFLGKMSYYPKELKPHLLDKGVIYRIHDFSDDPVESPVPSRSYKKSGIASVTYDYRIHDIKSIVTLIGDPTESGESLYVCLPGIKINSKTTNNYSENEQIIRLCIQDVFNSFGLINPLFHVFQEAYRVQFSENYTNTEKIFYGNVLRRFILHLAWIFAEKNAPILGINEENVRDMMIRSLAEWAVQGEYQDVSEYVDNIEKKLGSKNIGYVIMNPWSTLKEYYQYGKIVDLINKNVDRFALRLRELWKRNLNGEWKKIS